MIPSSESCSSVCGRRDSPGPSESPHTGRSSEAMDMDGKGNRQLRKNPAGKIKVRHIAMRKTGSAVSKKEIPTTFFMGDLVTSTPQLVSLINDLNA